LFDDANGTSQRLAYICFWVALKLYFLPDTPEFANASAHFVG